METQEPSFPCFPSRSLHLVSPGPAHVATCYDITSTHCNTISHIPFKIYLRAFQITHSLYNAQEFDGQLFALKIENWQEMTVSSNTTK